jgi:hypothetical protein
MGGEAHVQRGAEIRYYRCPTLGRRARRCPAELVESSVLSTIADGVLPPDVLEAARHELRERLSTPDTADVGRQRQRLTTRLAGLKKQHAWGDIDDAEYQAQRDATKVALAALPEGGGVAVFDAHRTRILELPEAVAVASPIRREELCRIVLERVVVRDREVEAMDWTPAAHPFFEKQRGVPPRGFEPLISTLKGWRPRPLDDGGREGPESSR